MVFGMALEIHTHSLAQSASKFVDWVGQARRAALSSLMASTMLALSRQAKYRSRESQHRFRSVRDGATAPARTSAARRVSSVSKYEKRPMAAWVCGSRRWGDWLPCLGDKWRVRRQLGMFEITPDFDGLEAWS